MILPDDVIDAETPCLQQMVEAYAEVGGNMVATMEVPRGQRLVLRHPRRRRRDRRDDAGARHGGEAEARGRAVEHGGDRPLHPVAAGAAQPRRRQGGRRRRDPADRRHRRRDRGAQQRLRLPLQGAPLRLRLEVGLPAGHRRLRPGAARPARRVPRLPADDHRERRSACPRRSPRGPERPGRGQAACSALPSVRIA